MTPKRITQLAISAMARYRIQQDTTDEAIGHIKDAIITAINETKEEDAKIAEEIWPDEPSDFIEINIARDIRASKIKE